MIRNIPIPSIALLLFAFVTACSGQKFLIVEEIIELENIDLGQSSQFVDGKWMPLSGGMFDVMFP